MADKPKHVGPVPAPALPEPTGVRVYAKRSILGTRILEPETAAAVTGPKLPEPTGARIYARRSIFGTRILKQKR